MSHIPSKAMPHAAPHHDDHQADEAAAPVPTTPPAETVTPAEHAGQAGRAEPGASPAAARAGVAGSAAAWIALGAGVIATAVAVVRRFTAESDATPKPPAKAKRKHMAKHD